eukprot:TRINITY_DN19152_c0_g1_i1.p1 TRINITY_DN19152_c0_g1~~TRINITY_DN19152_c0_g1_i1.p1  ORF type:complete len:492 (-),score=133.55 TRINITY_DN19152_c0_g1_i1:269-1687(-)
MIPAQMPVAAPYRQPMPQAGFPQAMPGGAVVQAGAVQAGAPRMMGVQQPAGVPAYMPQAAAAPYGGGMAARGQPMPYPGYGGAVQQQLQPQQPIQQLQQPAPGAALPAGAINGGFAAPAPLVPPPPKDAACEAVDHDLRAGDWVKLKGAAFQKDYDGKVFQVEVPNVGDGRVLCKFEVSDKCVKKMYMDPNSIERCDAPAAHELPPGYGRAPQAQNGVARPTVGISGRVRLVGLPPQSTNHGAMGWVVAPGIPDAAGCVKVQLDGQPTVVELPTTYLEKVEGATIEGAGSHLRTGERVEIVNMNTGGTNHNGRVGTVETLDPATGTVVVCFDEVLQGNARISVNPAFVKSLETGRVGQQPMLQPTISINPMPQGGVQQQMQQPMMQQPMGFQQPMQQFAQPQQPMMQPAAAVSPSGIKAGDWVVCSGVPARPQYEGKPAIVEAVKPEGLLLKLVGESSSLILQESYCKPMNP